MRNTILGLLLLLSPAHVFAENLSQLITDARVLAFDAASSTRQRFSDTQITTFLNSGQRQAMAQTHCLMGSMSFQLSPGTTYYPLPTNFLAFRRVTIGSLYMTEMSPASLDGRSRGWEAASGHPTYYFVNFSSRGLVGFAPWPATATDTDTVKIEYEIQATDMASSTDTPYNGVSEMQDYHNALPYYAASLMTIVDGLQMQSQLYLQVFTANVATMQKRCMDRVNYLPSAAGSQ